MSKVKCELCGRSLDRNKAKSVPVIGYVGSSCYKRVGAARDVLEANGLGALSYGALRLTLEDIRAGRDPLPSNASQVAQRLGFLLRSESERNARGEIIAATFWLDLKAGRSLRRAIKSNA